MCIIIHSPSGVIDDAHLRKSLAINSDGWGFSIAQGETLHTCRGLSLETFWAAWEESRKTMAGLPVLFHARIRTQGKIQIDNCHPFPAGEGWVMAHNGCIWGLGDKKRSDTSELASIIRAVGPNSFMTVEGRTLLKNVIGANDKLVFLHASGMYVRVNASFGHECDGNWYSNYSYKDYSRPVVEWKSTSTTVTHSPRTGVALGAPGKKTKPRFQEEDISALRPELRKLRADIIVRSALKSQETKKRKRRSKAAAVITGLADTKSDDTGKLQCDRGLVFYDDMTQHTPNKFAEGYSQIDWDSMGEDDWKRAAARFRAEDGENTRVPD